MEAKWCIYSSVYQTIIGSDNGLSPDWCQAIIWTSAGISLIGPLGPWEQISVKFKFEWNKFKIIIQENEFENVVSKTADILSQPQCLKVTVA